MKVRVPLLIAKTQALDTPGDRDGHAHHGGDALLDRHLHVVAGEAPVVDVVVRASRPAGQQDLAAQALARLEAHAEPVPGRRAGPIAEHHRAGRRVVDGDARDVRVAQLLDGARDALEHHGEIEGLVHAARELGEQLGLAAPPLRLAVEARVLERERGLIGKPLEQRRVGVEEDPALAIGHAERPDDAPLHAQRDGEHRPLARGHRLRSHVRGDDDARVVEEIRRPHGAAIGDGAARDPRSRRHHVAGNGVHARGGASRDGHERPVRLDQAEPRRAHAEDRQDALDGAAAHVAHVEALGEVLGEPGQRLGLMLPPAGLVIEPGIVEGHDGLVCEGLGHLRRLAGEHASDEVGDGEHTEDAIGGEQRHREDRPVGPLLELGAVVGPIDGARVAGEIRRRDGGTRPDGETDNGLASSEARGPLEGRIREAGLRQQGQAAGLGIAAVHRGGRRGEEGLDAVGNAPRHQIRIEALGDHASHLGQGLGAAPPRLARGEVTRVPNGRGRLHDECLQATALPDAQLERRASEQGEHAQERALERDGEAQIAGEAARLAPVSGDEPRIGGDPADVQRAAMERHPADSAASIGLGAGGILAREPLVGHRLPLQDPGVLVGGPDHDQGRARELGRGGHHRAQHVLEIEGRRHERRGAGQPARARTLRGGYEGILGSRHAPLLRDSMVSQARGSTPIRG